MGITKLENQNLNDNVITSSKTTGTSVDSSKIGANITNDDISPSANISTTKLDLSSVPSSQFVKANGTGGTINVQGIDEAIFNVGLLGFKMAVQEGLTIFNLVDGVVDEFNSEGGVDTAENSNSIYDASGDFYSNQQVNNVELLFTTSTAHLADPSQAPILTYNAQVVGATEAQAMADSTAPGSLTSSSNYYKATQLTSFANITWPSATTSCTATLIGGGGGSYPGGPNNGGAGGSVKATINDPEMGGTTYDIMIAGGGYKRSAPQLPTGGIGGGGHGVHAQGGGASAIFNGEATIQPGCMYGLDDSGPSPFSTPQGTPSLGPGHGGTATPGSAPLTVLAVGGGAADIYAPHTGGSAGDFSQGRRGGDGSQTISSVSYPEGASGGGGRGPTSPYDPSPTSPSVGAKGSGRTGSTTQAGDGINWPQQFFRGGAAYNPPSPGQYDMGGGGSGYRGGGDGWNSGVGHSGKSGGGAGFHNTSLVPAPSITKDSPVFPSSPINHEAAFKTDIYPTLPASGRTLFDDNAPYVGDGANSSKPNPTNGGDGAVFLQFDASVLNSSLTLVSDTFTANSTPSTARIVVFAELPDGTSDFTVSATRDNTTYNAITLTDEGYVTGSSGTKVFTGSTPLTGSASPQVQLRWKIVGSSLTGNNKIHGVSLQWA